MGQVAHEVVGAELVLGVLAVLLEVGLPPRQLRPPLRGEVGVAVHLGDGGAEQDQVAALLDRHHVGLVLRVLAAAVDLAVGLRIGADVVRGERELPARRRAVDHRGGDQRLGVGRTHQQELRRGGVDDVDGGDAAVAAVLLGEEHRLLVGVGRQSAAGQRLAIGQRGDLRVADAARPRQVGHQVGVERLAAPDQPGIVSLGGLEQLGGAVAVPPPVRAELLAEELDRVDLVVRDHQVPRDRARRPTVPRSKVNARTWLRSSAARGMRSSSIDRERPPVDEAGEQFGPGPVAAFACAEDAAT